MPHFERWRAVTEASHPHSLRLFRLCLFKGESRQSAKSGRHRTASPACIRAQDRATSGRKSPLSLAVTPLSFFVDQRRVRGLKTLVFVHLLSLPLCPPPLPALRGWRFERAGAASTLPPGDASPVVAADKSGTGGACPPPLLRTVPQQQNRGEGWRGAGDGVAGCKQEQLLLSMGKGRAPAGCVGGGGLL